MPKHLIEKEDNHKTSLQKLPKKKLLELKKEDLPPSIILDTSFIQMLLSFS